MYEYKCTIVRIVDGDTIDVDIDLGFDVVMKNQRVRLKGVNVAESRTTDPDEKLVGKYATKKVKTLFPLGSVCVLHSEQYNAETGKFGRILGDISRNNDLLPFPMYWQQSVLNAGVAVDYDMPKDEQKAYWNQMAEKIRTMPE